MLVGAVPGLFEIYSYFLFFCFRFSIFSNFEFRASDLYLKQPTDCKTLGEAFSLSQRLSEALLKREYKEIR